MNALMGTRDEEASQLVIAAVLELRDLGRERLSNKIITVKSPKGGEGKSTIAKEVSYALDMVLADLDWDGGRISRLLYPAAIRHKKNPLMEALEDPQRKAPKLYTTRSRLDIIAGHPDLEPNQPTAENTAELLMTWQEQYGRGMCVDTHPGGSPSSMGAAAAADLILMPVSLGVLELNAVEEALEEMAGYNILLVLNKMVPNPPAALATRLLRIAKQRQVPIAKNAISKHDWIRTRAQNVVISASPYLSVRSRVLVNEFLNLGKEILTYV